MTEYFNKHIQNKLKKSKSEQSFFHQEIASRLADRLLDTTKEFSTALEIGSSMKDTVQKLKPTSSYTNTNNLQELEEGQTYDLILSNLRLPYIENVREHVLSAGKKLKGDGLFLASTLGRGSFKEFKEAFEKSESGSEHLTPMPDLQNVGALLQSLKFALPVIDRDIITIHYDSFADIYKDMRTCGSFNFHPNRAKGLTGKSAWKKMEDNYPRIEANGKSVIPVTIEVIYLHGWRPHKSQQQPLKPGSATVSLEEILK